MKQKALDPMAQNQINMFDVIDAPLKRKKADEEFAIMTEKYLKWVSLPDITIVKENSNERHIVANMVWDGNYDLYNDAEHQCEQKPSNIKIWENPAAGANYWVINKKPDACGESCDTCPFCHAELSKGKGDVVLIKAAPWRWNRYLYYYTPMHERGFVTPEERANASSRENVINDLNTADFHEHQAQKKEEEMER